MDFNSEQLNIASEICKIYIEKVKSKKNKDYINCKIKDLQLFLKIFKKALKEIDKEPDNNILPIIEEYHKKIHTLRIQHNKYWISAKAKNKIKQRLKDFTIEDLLKAIDNFSRNDWWIKNNSHRGIAWFFHTSDRIEQFLNLEQSTTPIYKDLSQYGKK